MSLIILHNPQLFFRSRLLYFFRMSFDRFFIVGLEVGLLFLRLFFKCLYLLRILQNSLLLFAFFILYKPVLRLKVPPVLKLGSLKPKLKLLKPPLRMCISSWPLSPKSLKKLCEKPPKVVPSSRWLFPKPSPSSKRLYPVPKPSFFFVSDLILYF